MYVVLIAVLAISAFGVFVAELKLGQDLVRYRIDIGTKQSWSEGRSLFPQRNVSNPANYLPEGMPRLRTLHRLAMTRLILTALIVGVFCWAYVLN